MNSKMQGAIAVAEAISHFTKSGLAIFLPIADVSRYDLVVDIDGLKRVECKSSTHQTPEGNWKIDLRTSGGNQSWNKVIRSVNSADCDLVFIWADNKCWLIPAIKLDGRKTITVGGSKWSEFAL